MKSFSNIEKNMKYSKINENIEHQEPKDDSCIDAQELGPVNMFLNKLIESREVAHIFHLKANGDGSNARHLALAEYYNSINVLFDTLVEVYQGQYGIVSGYGILDKIEYDNEVSYFGELVIDIKKCKKCFLEEDTHLHSIIDEIVCLLYKTIYKLSYLK